MSTRWYPLYQQGNPQLRVYLTDFWMKLVRPTVDQPKNVVQFITSLEMTDFDIKNYLEKIYKVPVVEVKTSVVTGDFRRQKNHGYIVKDDDYRRAFITLPRDTVFEFPEVTKKKTEKEDKESYKKRQEDMESSYRRFEEKTNKRPGVPGWFGL